MALGLTLKQMGAMHALELGNADREQQIEIFNLLKKMEKTAFKKGISIPDFEKTDKPKHPKVLYRNQRIWNLIHRDGMTKTAAFRQMAQELTTDKHSIDESSIREAYGKFEKEMHKNLASMAIELPDGPVVRQCDSGIPIFFKET